MQAVSLSTELIHVFYLCIQQSNKLDASINKLFTLPPHTTTCTASPGSIEWIVKHDWCYLEILQQLKDCKQATIQPQGEI